MINFYKLFKSISFLLLLSVISLSTKAQTTLVAGDIAFTGYVGSSNSPQSDAFSFVLLRAMSAGTVIRFTDNAFGNDLVLKTNEQTLTLTLAANYAAGVEITISGEPNSTTISAIVSGNGTSAGTATGNMLSLSVNGDQVIAYQSATAGTPPYTFISALHMNVYNGGTDPSVTTASTWDNLPSATQTLFSCFIPTGLTNGTNAMWFGTQGNINSERNNGRFNCNTAIMGGADLTTIAGIRAACNNQAFWNGEFVLTGTPTSFPLPSNCNYAGVLLPVKLISFQAQNNLSSVLTKWKVSNQIDVSHYEIERSFNAINFDKVGTVTAKNYNNTIDYSFEDNSSLRSNAARIYYRLKTVDLNGEYTYSQIVNVRNSKNGKLLVDNLTNPISDQISFSIVLGTSGLVNIKLSDLNGKLIQTKTIQLNAGRTGINVFDTKALSKGIYLLQINSASGNIVHKVVK